jgi:hypothetical protein
VSHDTYFNIRSDGKLLWAGGSRQVKLIDGVAVPLLEGGDPPVSMGFGGLPPFDGQEQEREWTRVSTFKT